MSRTENFKTTHFSRSYLETIFKEIDGLFMPALSERILNKSTVSSFSDYIDKVLENGYLIVQHDGTDIQGFIAFYANNFSSKRAYIPILAIREKYQKQGIGSKLLKAAVAIMQKTGMEEIIVTTWKDNSGAIYLYKSNGFNIIDTNEKDVALSYDLTNMIL